MQKGLTMWLTLLLRGIKEVKDDCEDTTWLVECVSVSCERYSWSSRLVTTESSIVID